MDAARWAACLAAVGFTLWLWVAARPPGWVPLGVSAGCAVLAALSASLFDALACSLIVVGGGIMARRLRAKRRPAGGGG